MALSNTLKNLSLEESYILVAAIDFGTTFSGYAFSFKHKPGHIIMNKNWGAELGCQSYKTPTCVMTNPDGSFHSFGYAAEDSFSQLLSDEVEVGGPNGYNLYRNFKMMLHNQDVNLESCVHSTSGHITKAIDIFTMALKYLKGHMMEPIEKALASPPDASDIRWVLTVPAIWSDQSKGFMREAAYRAGLISEKHSRQLLIALEPEAASIYCRTLDVHLREDTEQQQASESKFQSGQQILIIDAGGGTVDITAHEVLSEENVKEISPPSGGPWGGTKVDQKFCKLLAQLFGTDVINYFKSAQPQQWLEFMTDFEKAKKAMKPDGTSSVKVRLPYTFGKELTKKTDKSVEDLVRASNVSDVSFTNGYLILKHQKAMDLFSDPVTAIVTHVTELTSEEKLPELKYILLVGGFAECKVLQEACREAFSGNTRNIKMLIPDEAQLAIMKGAVLFGHNPVQIKSRIARYTYGTDSRCLFKKGVHDPAKKITGKDGKERCKDHFSVFVTKGDEIKTGSCKTITYGLAFEDQKDMHFNIFKTEKPKVLYVDEQGVKKISEAILTSETGTLGKRIQTKVTFGHTELMIEARDATKEGEEFPMKMSVDFLSE